MTPIQEAKSRGGLIGIGLADLDRASVVEIGLLPRDYDQCACGFPNAADVEIAETDVDVLARYLDCDEEHAEAVKLCHQGLARVEAAGSGSWGRCNSEQYPDHHSVLYGVDVDSFPSHYQREVTTDEIRELSEGSPWWGWSFEEAMDRFGGKTVLDVCLLVGVEETFRLAGNAHIRVDSKPSRGIWIRSRRIPGSTIGLGWFPGAGCNSHVEFHIDSGWNASLQAKIGLFGHECGHTNNLPHEFAGQSRHKSVMSYTSKFPYEGFSTGKAPHTLPRDASWSRLERYYSPRPVPTGDDPDPTPPPPGSGPSEAEFKRLQAGIDKQLADFHQQHYSGTDPIIWG